MSTLMIAEDVRAQAAHIVEAREELHTQVGKGGNAVLLPPELNSLIVAVLQHAAEGKTLQVQSFPDELTPASAAEFLGVSRPTVMKWIRQGEIPSRMVGSHHRVATVDVREFKKQMKHRCKSSFDALRDLEEGLGISSGE